VPPALCAAAIPFHKMETAMFPFAPASKLMTTMATGTITLANVLVQWPFVVAYRACLPRP
jgi:lipid A disaccharide synthetase